VPGVSPWLTLSSTGEAERMVRERGMGDVIRTLVAGWIAFASFALLTFGLGRLYLVTGVKRAVAPTSA
jgi:hypothetical protein